MEVNVQFVGRRVVVTDASGSAGHFAVGDSGTIVGLVPDDREYYVHFDPSLSADKKSSNAGYRGAGGVLLGVWAVLGSGCELIDATESVTVVHGAGVAGHGWVPDTARHDVMDITRGMFE